MARRLHNWLLYNLAFALFPLSTVLLLRALTGSLTIGVLANSPEILFFALMINAAALGDLNEIAGSIGWPLIMRISGSFLFLGTFWSAVLYGSLLFDIVVGSGSVDFRMRLMYVSIGLAGACLIVSTAVEVLIGRIEEEK